MAKIFSVSAFTNLLLGFVVCTAMMGPAQQAPAGGHAKELITRTALPKTTVKLSVTSPAFKDGGEIPYENTQYRGNVFPGLVWTKGPSGTLTYAVVVQGESLTGAGGETSIHLTLFNIPGNVTALKVGMTDPPVGAIYGPNVHGRNAS